MQISDGDVSYVRQAGVCLNNEACDITAQLWLGACQIPQNSFPSNICTTLINSKDFGSNHRHTQNIAC